MPPPKRRKQTFADLSAPNAKKRKRNAPDVEVEFDRTARAEYLTGFHKRKVARIKAAQDEAAKKAKEEFLVNRKRIRETRKQELQEHVESINAMIRPAAYTKDEDEDEDIWEGISSEDEAPPLPVPGESEYIDEDKFTTVTVTAMSDDESSAGEPAFVPLHGRAATHGVKPVKERKVKPKEKKKKKFRYLTKGERREGERKEKGIRSKKAYERREKDGDKKGINGKKDKKEARKGKTKKR